MQGKRRVKGSLKKRKDRRKNLAKKKKSNFGHSVGKAHLPFFQASGREVKWIYDLKRIVEERGSKIIRER